MMSKKSPQLRFEGFTDDWELRKLGDVGDTFTGLTGKTKEDFGHGSAKFVTYVNVFRNPIATLDQLDAVEIDEKQNQVQKGDVFFTTSSETPEEVGMSSVWTYDTKNVYLNSFTFGYRPRVSFDLNYMASMLRSPSIRKKITFLAQGISRYNISKTKMLEIEIPAPNLSEQTKIGLFFKGLDDTIALHQRKLDLLKEQKKGYLQKMFPKNGEKVPELRFAGFADDWELRKSKELCTISTGKGNTQDKVDDGAYPFYVRSATIEKSDEYLYDQEAVLTVGDGVGTGKVYHYVNGKYNLHQRVYRMYDFKDVSAKYFYYYFSKNFYKRVMSMTAKTSVDSVRMEMIADMNIVFPSVKEQENIVELFSNLDNTIALHQRKLDLLKEQKKGFLQKMFV
jgi:type I restriction enzyme S subunit